MAETKHTAKTTALKEVVEKKAELVEIEANGGGTNHTVMFGGHRIDFVGGKASVLAELVDKLKKANLIK